MQSWKIDLLSDYRLSKILDRHYDKNMYLVELLQENHPTFSEIYSKLSGIKQNLVNFFMEKLGENYKLITKDLVNLENIHLEFSEIKKSEKNLKNKVNSLNKEFNQEYESLSKNLPLLEKVYEVSTLTRNSLKFLQNLRLLKSLMVNNEIIDLKKGSLIINDLFVLAKSYDFSGLPFYENEKEFINNTRENLMSKTQKKFLIYLQNKQEEETKTCLNTFANLNILSDVVTQTGTNMLKTCMNLWKNFLIKDYDQNTILMSYSQELKNVLNESLSLSTSIWLLQNLLKNSENYENLISDKNLLNIFDLFWNKEITIVAQSFQKLKENSNKYEINWKVTVRLYPKIFHAFEDFLTKFRENTLLYPGFPETVGFENSLNNFMNSIVFLKEKYYEWVKNEVEGRLLLILSNIFSPEIIKTKEYMENIYQSSCKMISFLQFEFNDNIKSKEIFIKVQKLCLEKIREFVLALTEKTYKENLEDISSSTLFLSINILGKILLDCLNLLLLSKHNAKLNFFEIDEIIEIYENSFSKLSVRYIEKIFSECLKIFSFMYENHLKSSQKLNFQTNAWESLSNLLNQHNPSKLSNLLEKNMYFTGIWEDFLCVLINLYSFLMSIFSNQSEKFLDLINKDIDIFKSLLEKISGKDHNNRILLCIINMQKLFLLDAANMNNFCEGNPNFFNLVSKNITIFNFFKRIEKESNFKMKKADNFNGYLSGFFLTNDLKFVKLKELIFGDFEKTNVKEIFENLKKSGNVNLENPNMKFIQKNLEK